MSPSHGTTTRPSRTHQLGGWLKEIVITVLAALVISALLRALVLEPFIIPSVSMENTLKVDDRVVVQKLTHVQRGDVIVFQDPANWLDQPVTPRTGVRRGLEFVGLLPDSSKNYLIKRLIGMPGDTVKCCDAQGRMSVNGVALDESAYLYTDDNGVTVAAANVPFEVVVPAGRLFVMGDHRDASEDSRCHLSAMGIDAFVPVDKVVGPAFAIMLPFDRARWLSHPATFAAVPAASQAPPERPVIKPADVGC